MAPRLLIQRSVESEEPSVSTQPTPPSRVGALALVAALLPGAACTVYGEVDGASGEPAAVTIALLDLDGDGAWDGVDLDGDELSDVAFDADCDRMLVGGSDGSWDGLDFDCNRVVDAAACARPLVNNDDDAFADGIDLDCDGLAELSVQTGPPNCWPAPLDDDGDGRIDGIDSDCDGEAEHTVSPPTTPDCWPTAMDIDDDGYSDGVDFDCDGDIDSMSGPYGSDGEASSTCWAALDDDGDGFPDGLDLDCDGSIDW